MKKSSKRIPFIVLLIAGLACSMPGLSAPAPISVNTSIAETVIAGLTESALQQTTPTELETTGIPTFTFTPGPPTVTPTATQTPTSTFTPTLAVPLISVSVGTNCRTGPGKVYNLVGGLQIDETAQVYGRDPTNAYWYIRNPRPDPEFCWVWGEYATLTGPFLLLPVLTPPPTPTPTRTSTPTATPTPTPNFTAKYVGLDSCVGWWTDIELKNTGAVSFRSIKIVITDTVTKVKLISLANGITDLDGCLTTTTKDVFAPGDVFTLSAPEFGYDPGGHKMHSVITLCSKTGQKGRCVTKKLNFKP